MGNGILLSNGDEHTKKKRLVLPSLDPKSLTRFVSIMENVANETTESLSGRVNVTDAMTTLAMDIVGLCLFSQGCSVKDSTETNAVKLIGECHDHLIHRERHPLSPPLWVPTRRNRRFRRNRKQLNEYIYGFIETGRQRSESDQAQQDLLQMLLTAEYEGTGTGLSDQELRDEVMTLFLAGHETSALALSFALWYLADPQNAHWQDK